MLAGSDSHDKSERMGGQVSQSQAPPLDVITGEVNSQVIVSSKSQQRKRFEI